MEQIGGFWAAQDKRRMAVLALVTVAAFAAVLLLARLATAPRMELLFAELDAPAAAEVVASLEGRGVLHEVRGRAVYVDGAIRDSLRLQLAGEGLPRMDGAGYEILDGLSGFGTTSQMFDAAYWRAREGELTRTILASPGVKLARVHLATADASPFARDRSATASVTLRMASGAVDPGLARAVRSLVAGAVRDLSPDDVTVIDSGTGRVLGGGAADDLVERQDAHAAGLRAAVENLLAARVGPGRSVVELAVARTSAAETITERRLDPDSRVVVSTDTEERSADDRGGAGGVTVASNLPDGDAADAPDRESRSAETRERVNYDMSATQRRIERGPGAIERVSVAVLVDGLRGDETGDDADWAPRPEAELAMLRDLVASAVGAVEARGDVITVRTIEFGALAAPEAAPGLSLARFSGAQVTQMVTAALLAAVALGAMVVLGRTISRRSGAAAPLLAEAASLAAPDAAEMSMPAADGRAPDAARGPGGDGMADLSNLGALSLPGPGGDEGERMALATAPADPVERLRALISDRREETIEVLRDWAEDEAEDAR